MNKLDFLFRMAFLGPLGVRAGRLPPEPRSETESSARMAAAAELRAERVSEFECAP